MLTIDVTGVTDAAYQVADDCGFVVIDLFRATSTIQVLIDQRCRVIPIQGDPATATQTSRPRVGEWKGRTPADFLAGNSPVEARKYHLSDIDIDFFSTNGVAALSVVQESARVLCASLFNKDALVDAVIRINDSEDIRRWFLLPCGRRGKPSIEDNFVAALIGEQLLESGASCEPATSQFVARHKSTSKEALLASPGADFLRQYGASEDLEFILYSEYLSERVPELSNGVIRPLPGEV